MILVFGGTTESATVTRALSDAGYAVLVSTATDVPIDLAGGSNVQRRCGRMDKDAIQTCIAEYNVEAIVDAAHPYAVALHENAASAAISASIPYLRFARPASSEEMSGAHVVENHEQAAQAAFGHGKPVLLTTGSRNLTHYVRESRKTGIRVVARVLPHPDSLRACLDTGLDDSDIIQARGPFSVQENCDDIRAYGIGVLVTKDSGAPGGLPEKLEAARLEGCKTILISRPSVSGPVFESIAPLLEALLNLKKESTEPAGSAHLRRV